MPIVGDLAFGTGPGTDRTLAKPNRKTGAAPSGVLTPQYSGELVIDTSTTQVWCGAADGTNTNWTPVFIG